MHRQVVTDNSSVSLPGNMKQPQELLVKIKKLELHKCDRCPKVFHNVTGLMKHMAYHDEWFLSHVISAYVNIERAKIFNCDRCTQSFCTKRDFKLHKVQHILKTVRDQRTEQRLKLTNDEMIKPHKCPDCDYEFVAKSSLDEHSVVHLPFPHICKCGIGYYKQQDLLMHKKLVHKSETSSTTQPKTNSVQSPKNEVKTESKIKPVKGPTLKAVLIKKEKSARKRWKMKVKSGLEVKRKLKWNIQNPDIQIIRTPDNRYQCPGCTKTLASKTGLYTHYRIHTGQRPFPCKQCGKCFTQSNTLITHMERHADQRNYMCRYCSKSFYTKNTRARHEILHGAKPYECPLCGKGFHDPSALARHKRIHTGEKRYQCPYCAKRFADSGALYRHKLMHQNKKDFECDICQKKFYTISILKKHLTTHTGERNFCCDYCKQYYSSKANLAIHIRRHISFEKRFICDYCKKSFYLKNNLNTHILRVHNNTKHLFCKDCNKLCTSLIQLKCHMKKHEKTIFKCNDCPKIYKIKHELTRHYMSIHTRIRCDKCRNYFPSQTDLKKHLLEESEMCEICEKEFFCKNLKDIHLKVHIHKKKKYKCTECGKVLLHKKTLDKHLARHRLSKQ